MGDYRNFIGSYRYQHRQYSDHAKKEPPPMSDSNTLRTRIAAALRTYMFENSTAEELADAVIDALGLEPQMHYDPDCEFYRWVTDWIDPQTSQKVDLP